MASPKTLKLEGKVAVITGGANGIGEATARLFVAHGAFVVIADNDDSNGSRVAASVSPPGRCAFVHCDVCDDRQVAAAVEWAVSAHGRLDVMFASAGVAGQTSRGVLDMDPGDMDLVLAVNVRGTASAIKHSGRAMAAAGTRGSIICMASVMGMMGFSTAAAYVTSKHAVLGLTRAAAAELGGNGVRVNCISPFVVATALTCRGLGGVNPGTVEQLACAATVLKGAVLRTADVAAAALFLASDDSAFISGHNLVVDGAFTSTNITLGFPGEAVAGEEVQ